MDLATSSDKQSHQYGNLVYGNYLYSNHNGTIKATVWNENTFEQVFVLSLYDSSGNLVKKENLTIGGRVIGLFNYKSVTFSGLSTSKTYYYVLSQSTNTQYDQTIEIKR